jgi:hypothetical protein
MVYLDGFIAIAWSLLVEPSLQAAGDEKRRCTNKWIIMS